jgi:hypothetical protein
MAVGIDREEDTFIVTSQIAIPESSKQGQSSKTVQLVSRGKTISEAFEQINTKTGWYPKLVFCKLIVIGEKAAQDNVFDALDFFLLDEYLADDCQVAVCEGLAKDVLNVSPLVDPSSSVAIGKVLSAHAERVGTVRPTTLKDFSIGYFGDSHSALLPVLKTEPQQEEISSSNPSENSGQGGQGSDETQSESEEQSGGNSQSEESEQSGKSQSGSEEQNGEKKEGGEKSQNNGEKPQNKPVFSARQTALFVRGKWQGTLTPEETFAVNAAIGKLRLANYSVDHNGQTCTLTVKRNAPKIKLEVGKDGSSRVQIQLTLTAGIADYSKALDVNELADAGDIPDGIFFAAEKKLAAELTYMHALRGDLESAEESGKLCKEYLQLETASAKRILLAYAKAAGKTEALAPLKEQAEKCLESEKIAGVRKFEEILLARIEI